MKKSTVLFSFVLVIAMASCTKNNDFIKEELEKALPTIEVTSLGLVQQVGPFLQADVIKVTFGGAITKAEPGAFDIAWYDGNTRTDSVHFNSWTEKAVAATANNAITTDLIPTTYPNTRVISGNLVLKLSKLPAGSKSYTLKVYARTKENVMATVSVAKLITVK